MPDTEPTSADADGLVGGVTIWPSPGLPGPKYRFCEGEAVSRTQFSLLFSRLGVLHGVGDGSTTFNLPDYKKKFLVGLDETDSAYDVVGESVGTATAALPANTGAGTSHTHGAGTYSVSAPNAAPSGATNPVFAGASGSQPVSGTSGAESSHTHPLTGSVATIPPSKVVRYIIKVA